MFYPLFKIKIMFNCLEIINKMTFGKKGNYLRVLSGWKLPTQFLFFIMQPYIYLMFSGCTE